MGTRTALAAAGALLLPVGAIGAVTPAEPGGARPALSAAAAPTVTGWWPSTRQGQQGASDCGDWRVNADGYCVADDARNGLEVGTRFRTSEPVEVIGVRLYRVDSSEIAVSVWDEDRNRVGTGVLPAGTADGWQDVALEVPVTAVPGPTYTVSYFTPRTRYAFEYRYFSDRARTVGPVTALEATAARPNGVHCYAEAACGSFPVRPHKSSTYWVTPLWRTDGTPATGSPGPSSTPEPTEGPKQGPKHGPGKGKGADRKAPRVVAKSPAAGSRQPRAGVRVKARFSEPVRRASVSARSVRLLRVTDGGDARRMASKVSYAPDRRQAVLVPRSGLRRGATYRVRVTPRVRDLAGNRLDQAPRRTGRQSVSWTFRTR